MAIFAHKKRRGLLSVSHQFTLITGILLTMSLVWLLTAVVPVLVVEAKYQYRTMLNDFFHVPDLRALIIPDFEFDPLEQSRYKNYGIKIPKIYLDEPVIFNVDPNDPQLYTEALKHGIAHASSTAFPDHGGIGYYFAHSSNPDFRNQLNAVFYLLGKLEIGDDIYLWHNGKKTDYQVTATKITNPGDVSFLYEETNQEESIVLQTCWPPGTTQKRLLVFAQRVD